MTRINLVPVSELMDQHLFAEFREIKMVPKSLRRSLNAYGEAEVLKRIPKEYSLGNGHIMFFYDKGLYLQKRFKQLFAEVMHRGYNIDITAQLDADGIFAKLDARFNKDYVPTPEALAIIKTRIAEKIAMKPNWYKHSTKD